jgi:hypothetical protein
MALNSRLFRSIMNDMLATRLVSILDCNTLCLLSPFDGFTGKSGGAGCMSS